MRNTSIILFLKKTIRSKLTWGIVLAAYLLGVWLSTYMIEVTSMDKWPVSEKQGCPHGKEYRLMNRERKPNPWILESTKEIIFNSTVLDNPICLGAYLKDISTYKFPYNIAIYDEKKDVVLFYIHKSRIQ